MPRISKTDVIFKVNDVVWLARFSHQHAKTVETKRGEKIIPVTYNDKSGKTIDVQHITTCKLGWLSQPKTYLTGVSPCSLQDEYNWRRGITRAFKKALERGGYCKFEMDPKTRREKVTMLKPEYTDLVREFTFQREIKDYAPHNQGPNKAAKLNTPILEGEVIAPPETRNGTAHLGMD